MTRMPLVKCPCDNARRLRRPHHIGVCFANTRTNRHCQAHCSRSGPFQVWPRQPVSLPFSLLCQSMCLVASVVYGRRHTILPCECSSRAVCQVESRAQALHLCFKLSDAISASVVALTLVFCVRASPCSF